MANVSHWEIEVANVSQEMAVVVIMTIQVNFVLIPSEAGMRQHKFT